MNRYVCALLVSLGAVGLGSVAASADTEGVSEAVRVSVVEVPVFVRDGSGRAVMDMRPEEFRVYEDGKLQKLVLHELITYSGASKGSAGAGAAATGSRPPTGGSEARRHFVFVFDLVFNDLGGIKRAREAAWHFVLDKLGNDDPVAIFAITRGAGVTMCSNFTTDRLQIAYALASLGADRRKNGAAGATDSAGLGHAPVAAELQAKATGKSVGTQSDLMDSIEDAVVDATSGRQGDNPEIVSAIEQGDRMSYRDAVRDYMNDLRSFGCSLAVLPGRKFVVFFSAGFDAQRSFMASEDTAIRSDTDTYNQVFGADRTLPKVEGAVGGAMNSAMACFSASDCRLFFVDASGLQTRETAAVQKGRQASLTYMASESGGELFQNVNDLQKPLVTMLNESQSYYLLAYTPLAQKGKQTFHQIKVEVSRPDLKITYRRGYYEDKPFTEYTELERDLQIARLINLGADVNSYRFSVQSLCFPVDAGPERGSSQVLIQVAVPGDQLQRMAEGRLELYAFAVDESGSTAGFFHAKPELSDEHVRERATQSGITYTEPMILAPGSYTLKVIVRDLASGTAALRSSPLDVKSFSTSALDVSTPCFLSVGGDSVNLRGTPGPVGASRDGGTARAYPLTFKAHSFVASASAFRPGQRGQPLLLRLYNAPADAGTGRPRVRLAWRVLSPSGQPEGAPRCELVGANGLGAGVTEMMFTFEPPVLPKGEHVLSVTVEDPESGESATNSVAFEVGS